MSFRSLLIATSLLAFSAAMLPAGQMKVDPPSPPAPPMAAPETPEFLEPQSVWISPGDAVAGGYGGGSYLGIDIGEITADRVQALKLKEERGVEVLTVDRDAPAGKAGLKAHDVILQFNGTPVEGVEQLRRLIHEIPPGRAVTLGLLRDGKTFDQKVQLADRIEAMKKIGKMQRRVFAPEPPETPEFPEVPAFPAVDVMVRMHSPLPGATVENLTPQLGEFFGVKNGEGILVRSVEKGSPAEQAGLRAADVIVKVDNQPVSDRGDWKLAMRGKSGKVTLGIVRDKKEQTLTVTVPNSAKDDQSYFTNPQDFDFDFDFDVPAVSVNLTGAQQAQIHEMARVSRKQAEKIRKQVQDSLKDLHQQLLLQNDLHFLD
jgi:serine protease Do